MKLVYISDKSEAFLLDSLDKQVQAWGGHPKRHISSMDDLMATDLMGNQYVQWLRATDKKHLDAVLERLKKEDPKRLTRLLSAGLVILSDVARTSTRTFEKTVKDMGGTVITPEKDGSKVTASLLEPFPLHKDVRAEITAYIGTDYELAIPLVKYLEGLTEGEVRSATLEDLWAQLPLAPGAVPVWEVERPLFAGRPGEAMEKWRRVGDRGKPIHLITLGYIRKRVTLMAHISGHLISNPKLTDRELAELTGSKPGYAFNTTAKRVRSLGHDRVLELGKIMAKWDHQFKGGSPLHPDTMMDMMVTEITLALK